MMTSYKLSNFIDVYIHIDDTNGALRVTVAHECYASLAKEHLPSLEHRIEGKYICFDEGKARAIKAIIEAEDDINGIKYATYKKIWEAYYNDQKTTDSGYAENVSSSVPKNIIGEINNAIKDTLNISWDGRKQDGLFVSTSKKSGNIKGYTINCVKVDENGNEIREDDRSNELGQRSASPAVAETFHNSENDTANAEKTDTQETPIYGSRGKPFSLDLALYHMAVMDVYCENNHKSCSLKQMGKPLCKRFTSIDKVKQGFFPCLFICIRNITRYPIKITNNSRVLDAIGSFIWEDEGIHETTVVSLAFDNDVPDEPLLIKPGRYKLFELYGRNLLMLLESIHNGTFEFFTISVDNIEYRFTLDDFANFKGYYDKCINKDFPALRHEDIIYRQKYNGPIDDPCKKIEVLKGKINLRLSSAEVFLYSVFCIFLAVCFLILLSAEKKQAEDRNTERIRTGYTAWSEEYPSSISEDLIESRTEYRYRDRERTIGYENSLPDGRWSKPNGRK